MNPIQEFLEWLKVNDPFVYDVMKKDIEQGGLGVDWGAIGSTLLKTAVAVVPAYMGYKSSKDAVAIQKASLAFQRQQQAAPGQTGPAQPPQLLPAPNKASQDEIIRRIQLALNNQPQPPATAYTPVIDPRLLPNYQEAVNVTAGGGYQQYLLPVGIALSLFLLTRVL